MRLKEDFFTLPATELAPKLLGKYICRKVDSGELVNGEENAACGFLKRDGGSLILRARITETECYYGYDDTASHASRGKTPRSAVMFGQGGLAYVYLCYGIHELFNIISGTDGHPEGVLIRGVLGANGPGKLTKFLGIGREFNGENLASSDRLWIEDGEAPEKILTSARIGIDYAEKKDRERLWRFLSNI